MTCQFALGTLGSLSWLSLHEKLGMSLTLNCRAQTRRQTTSDVHIHPCGQFGVTHESFLLFVLWMHARNIPKCWFKPRVVLVFCKCNFEESETLWENCRLQGEWSIRSLILAHCQYNNATNQNILFLRRHNNVLKQQLLTWLQSGFSFVEMLQWCSITLIQKSHDKINRFVISLSAEIKVNAWRRQNKERSFPSPGWSSGHRAS